MKSFMLLVVFWASAVGSEEILIILKPSAPNPPAPAPVPAAQVVAHPSDPTEPKTIAEAYERWYRMAYLVTLDSPSGPKPGLGLDNIYDSRGFPVPRLPDPFTLRMMLDPSNQTYITDYLDWRKAAIKRASLVANQLPEEALKRGILTPEVTAFAPARPTDQKNVGDLSSVDPKSLGAPLLSQAQARDLGITDEKEIPRLPGEVSRSGIEVYWYWSHRCSHCTGMARTWFQFAKAVNAAGHKAVSISTASLKTQESIDRAGTELAALIEIWAIAWGDEVDRARNWLDWTGTAKAFGVTGTPTIVFINRKSPKYPKIERLVGAQDAISLQTALAHVAGWSPDIWPPPAAPETPKPNSSSKLDGESVAPPGTSPILEENP